MSGIAGYVTFDGREADEAVLGRMNARQAHRGPDGASVWRAGPAGLAHRLLYTTPESLHERQPLANASGRLAISADARLDNREDLARALGLEADERPDCALILAAYEKWGASCAERLLGDFAFAIWDADQRLLFCARDHFGIKPLVYTHSARMFAFASEIKALFCLDETPRRINEARVADLLAPMLNNTQATYYEEIYRLPAAHTLIVTANGARLERFWRPDAGRRLRLESDEAYAAAFRDILAQAVGSRLRSAYPVGSMLSGGLDSSSVSCMGRHLLAGSSQRLHTFSVTFAETPDSDERGYMQSVLDGGGLEHHAVPGERLSPLEDVARVLWHRDEPWHGLGLCVQWATYRAAQAAGVRVLLSGNGGDISIGHGSGRLAELMGQGRWLTLAREINGLVAPHATRRFDNLRVWWHHSLLPFVPAPVRQARRSLRRAARPGGLARPGWSEHSLINVEFARSLERDGGLKRWRQPARRAATTERDAHSQGIESLASGQDTHDRATAAWGLEQRHPLLDVRLAEFCLSLPSEQKLSGGRTRVVLRRAMEGILPEPIRGRTDKGTPMYGLARAMLSVDRPLLDEVILGDSPELARYVNMPLLRQNYGKLLEQETPPMAQWMLVTQVARAVMLAVWLRQASGAAGEPAAREALMA